MANTDTLVSIREAAEGMTPPPGYTTRELTQNTAFNPDFDVGIIPTEDKNFSGLMEFHMDTNLNMEGEVENFQTSTDIVQRIYDATVALEPDFAIHDNQPNQVMTAATIEVRKEDLFEGTNQTAWSDFDNEVDRLTSSDEFTLYGDDYKAAMDAAKNGDYTVNSYLDTAPSIDSDIKKMKEYDLIDQRGDVVEMDYIPSDARVDPEGVQNASGEIAEMYAAYFDRAVENEGMQYWLGVARNIAEVDESVGSDFTIDESTREALSELFWEASIRLSEFSGYSADMTDEALVNKVYTNVLGRDSADQEGFNYWMDRLDNGLARDQFVQEALSVAHSSIEKNPNTDVSLQVDHNLEHVREVGTYFAQEGVSGGLEGEAAFNAGVDALSQVDELNDSVQASLDAIDQEIGTVGIAPQESGVQADVGS